MRMIILVSLFGIVVGCASDGSYIDSDVTVTFPSNKPDTGFIYD